MGPPFGSGQPHDDAGADGRASLTQREANALFDAQVEVAAARPSCSRFFGLANALTSPRVSTSTIAIGERFADRYRIEGLLGRGGMGAVYAVFDEQLGERVALKVLSERLALHEQALARFQREVRLARRVTSAHVARTHDIGVHDGVHYLTMELIDGESLTERLGREGALSIAEAVRIAKALASGLATAHEAGVLHRDLKPANVMLDADGRVVITDFGIARPAAESDDVQTIGFIGTPRYMAPEVVEGSPFDHRSDLYALGIIVYEMLTGKRYRLTELGDEDPTRTDTVQAAMDTAAPTGLEMLVRSLLKLVPAARPSSAREVANTLAELTAGSSVVPVRSAPLPRGRRVLVVPFKARGGDEASELAEVLSEELVDVLARNAGFQVLAHRSSDDDATAAGARAGVDYVVGGTVTRRGSAVRISVRLTETTTGQQLYSDRFDAAVTDVFDLQDRIAKRIGEALRVEVMLVARRGSADAEAVEHYLRGRRKHRSPSAPRGGGIEDFEAAIACAPDFGVAVAAHAISATRRWWVDGASPLGSAHRRAAEQSVQRALAVAPDLAETHLARGLSAAHRGEYVAAVEALTRALDIAPTCALAQDYLGQLECEAGRGENGSKRIALAHALDASVLAGQALVARWHAFSGRVEEGLALLDALDVEQGMPSVNRTQIRMRIAAWRGDHAAVAACRNELPVNRFPQLQRLHDYIDLVLGTLDPEAYHPRVTAVIDASTNHRFATYALQVAAEASSLVGQPARAAEYVTRATKMALADLDWLQRCPALAAMRELPSYDVLRAAVARQARTIWER